MLSRRAAVALMFAVALAGIACLMAWGPVVLRPQTHEFADARDMWGVRSGANLFALLPLLTAGAWGGWRAWRLPATEPLRWVWVAVFVSQVVVAVGGARYHWHPADDSYLWDQVPRSMASALLTLAFLAERIDLRFGRWLSLWGAPLAVALGVWWWQYTLGLWGAGDLRPLMLLELSPLCMLAAGGWTLGGHLLAKSGWQKVLLGFCLAQLLGWADQSIYIWSEQMVSGHTLCHLALAGSVGWAAVSLRPQQGGAPSEVFAKQGLPQTALPSDGAPTASDAEAPPPTPVQASATSLPESRLAS